MDDLILMEIASEKGQKMTAKLNNMPHQRCSRSVFT